MSSEERSDDMTGFRMSWRPDHEVRRSAAEKWYQSSVAYPLLEW